MMEAEETALPESQEDGLQMAGASEEVPMEAEDEGEDEAKGCGRSDPHGLHRFIRPHQWNFDEALSEIQAGCKVSHWSWYMFVTPYYPRGSSMNKRYAMKSDEEAMAFLRYKAEGVDLRQNYMRIMEAVAEKIESGRRLVRLVGVTDAPKLKSSVRYFRKIAQKCNDVALLALMRRLANALGLEEDDDDEHDDVSLYLSKLRKKKMKTKTKTKGKQQRQQHHHTEEKATNRNNNSGGARDSSSAQPPANTAPAPPASPDNDTPPRAEKKSAAWTVDVGNGNTKGDGKAGVGHVAGDVVRGRPVYDVEVRPASAQKLYNLVQGYWAVIVDVRDDEAFSAGHVYGAVSASEIRTRKGVGLRGKLVCYGEGEEDKAQVRDFLHDFLEENKGSKVKEAFAYEGGFDAFRQRYPFCCTVSPLKGIKIRSTARCPRLPNEILEGQLYLSGRRVALDVNAIMALRIKAIVNATPKCPCKFRRQGVMYLRLEVEDQPKESAKLMSKLEEAFDFIDTAREAKRPVLVHCAAGVSRSATVVIAYLMQREGYTLEKALAHVEFCRPEVKPNEGFMRMLTELDGTLKEQRTLLERVDQL